MATKWIDLNRLETSSLERYYRTYKLSEQPVYSRDELMPLILQHLAQLNVDEDEILIRFALACRRNGQRLGLNGVKSLVQAQSSHAGGSTGHNSSSSSSSSSSRRRQYSNSNAG